MPICVIEKVPGNDAAYVPHLPGCVATASTKSEVLNEIREAVAFHIEGLREYGEPVPEPQTTAAAVDVGVLAGDRSMFRGLGYGLGRE